MVLLGFLGWSVWVFALILAFWLLIAVDLNEEGDWYTLILPNVLLVVVLALLGDPVFLEVEDISHIDQLLLQLLIMGYILAICVETYAWPKPWLYRDGSYS
jgi:hypothetical protein